MTEQTRKERFRRILIAFRHFLVFFLTVCFILTCCMILFLNKVSDITGIELQREHIRQAAILTFVNVVILSLIFSLIDIIRRRIMVAGQAYR